MILRPPISTPTDPLFPYPSLFRSYRRSRRMHAPASRPFPCASSGAVMAAGTERAGAGMTAYKAYREVRRIAVLGCGTIGASWAAYFLARGYDVAAWDPAPGWEARLRSEEHTSELQSLMRNSYAVF